MPPKRFGNWWKCSRSTTAVTSLTPPCPRVISPLETNYIAFQMVLTHLERRAAPVVVAVDRLEGTDASNCRDQVHAGRRRETSSSASGKQNHECPTRSFSGHPASAWTAHALGGQKGVLGWQIVSAAMARTAQEPGKVRFGLPAPPYLRTLARCLHRLLTWRLMPLLPGLARRSLSCANLILLE